jgi:Immunoglobulin-like domain of bacterial spore germination
LTGKLWGSVAVGGVLHRARMTDVVAPVWLIDPQQGASVGRTFTAYIAGIVPEAAARLRVRTQSGAVVVDQPVHLDRGAPAQGTAKVPLTLEPGRYTIEAFFVSSADGSEQFADDHEFSVG